MSPLGPILLAMANVTAQPVALDPAAAAAFVHRASTAVGAPIRIDETRRMGRNRDIAQRIVEQVLEGQKRATLARQAEFAEKGWMTPRVGQTVLVYDFDGKPSFIYRVVATQQLALGAVAPWHLMAESPALRDLTAWRTAHLGAWKDAVKGLSADEVERLPVVWMRFEPVFPAAKAPH